MEWLWAIVWLSPLDLAVVLVSYAIWERHSLLPATGAVWNWMSLAEKTMELSMISGIPMKIDEIQERWSIPIADTLSASPSTGCLYLLRRFHYRRRPRKRVFPGPDQGSRSPRLAPWTASPPRPRRACAWMLRYKRWPRKDHPHHPVLPQKEHPQYLQKKKSKHKYRLKFWFCSLLIFIFYPLTYLLLFI